MDNYQIQAQQAKAIFLKRDHSEIARKVHLHMDENYLYVNFLCKPYRIDRKTADLSFFDHGTWCDGNSHGEIMTLLDILCVSAPDRNLAGQWESMTSFGLMFHQNLLEEQRDAWAERFSRDPDGFRRACIFVGAKPVSGGDMAFAFEICDGLCAILQFWDGDEEFSPRVRWLWDKNAKMYLKYETMYFAVEAILERIGAAMDRSI